MITTQRGIPWESYLFARSELALIHLLRNTEAETPVDWVAVMRLAGSHGVGPLLYRLLKDRGGLGGVPEDVCQGLRDWYLRNTARNLKLFHELSSVLGVLENEGIPVLLLKGSHLANHAYPDPGCRTMSDIDVLFKKRDLARTQQCLLDAGYLTGVNRLNLDIHWDLSLYVEKFDIDLEGVWERAQPFRIGNVEAWGLSPEDLLLHLCLHCSFHHESFLFAGLRTLCDIRAVISRHLEGLDWGLLERRARKWRAANSVFITLLLARDLISAPVPEDFLEGLDPGDFNDHVYEWALKQIMSGPHECSYLSPYFWQLWSGIPLRKKASGLLRLFLPPPAFVSQKYPARHTSMKNYIHYLVRTRDNVLRYGRAAWEIFKRDEATCHILERKRQSREMTEWLLTR